MTDEQLCKFLDDVHTFTKNKQEEMRDLKKGDKLIFVKYGGVLSAKEGNVFTFSNWKHSSYQTNQYSDTSYWQCEEIHNTGNHVHNFSIYDVEKFNPDKHTTYKIMTEDTIYQDIEEFKNTYGGADNV